MLGSGAIADTICHRASERERESAESKVSDTGHANVAFLSSLAKASKSLSLVSLGPAKFPSGFVNTVRNNNKHVIDDVAPVTQFRRVDIGY